MSQKFDIPELQKSIHAVWGEYGAHAELFGMLLAERDRLREALERCQKVLTTPSVRFAGEGYGIGLALDYAHTALNPSEKT